MAILVTNESIAQYLATEAILDWLKQYRPDIYLPLQIEATNYFNNQAIERDKIAAIRTAALAQLAEAQAILNSLPPAT